MPVEHIDIIKLLWGKGFELFPHFHREHESFTGYLFVFTGGKQGALELGKRIVEECN